MANIKMFFDHISHIETTERKKAMHRKLLKSMIRAENTGILDEDLKKEVRKYWDSIALMKSNEINNVLLRDTSTVIKNVKKNYGTKGASGNADKITRAYKNISRDFFGYMTEIDSWTAKKSTPQELMSKVVKLNKNIDKINYNFSPVRMHTDFNSIQQAYNSLKNAKSFYTINLGIICSKNEVGFKQLDTVTEFSIQQFDNAGNVIEGGGFSNLIGLSDDQANAYLKEIAEARESGGIKRMGVLLNLFSKYGHQDIAIEHVGDGQYVINQFVGEVAEGLNSYEIAERGVRKLAEVGRVQRANRLSGGIMLWEKQWIDGLEAIQKNVTVGYNSVYADMPWINQFNATRLPENGQKELKKRIGSNFLQLDPAKHFDYFVATNIASQAVCKAKWHTHVGLLSPALKEHGVSSLQQDDLIREYTAHLYEDNAAHTAKLDGRVLGYLSTAAKVGNQNFIDAIMEDAVAASSPINGEVVGGRRQLFITDKAATLSNFTNENALSFVEDQLSGTICTVGGYEIDPETGSVRKELVKQFPIKRNMAYTVDWIKQFDTNDEWLKQIGAVHPKYAQDGLFGIKVSSVLDANTKGANLLTDIHNNMYGFFTSLDELQGFVSSAFMQIGERTDVDGDWQELGGKAGTEVRKRLATYNITKNGLQKVPHNGSLISSAITNSTKKGINNSVVRMIREDGYKHAVKFNDLLTEVTKRAEAVGIIGPMNYRNARPILDEMLGQSQKIADKVSKNIPLTQEEQEVNTLHKILGWSNKTTGNQKLFSETYNKFVCAYDHLYGANPVFQSINESIEEFAGANASPEYKQYLHEQTLRHLRNEAITQHTDASRAAKKLGLDKPATIYGKDLNFFELDIDGFANKKGVMLLGELVDTRRPDNLLRINLGANGQHNLVSSLLGKDYSNTKTSNKGPEALKQLTIFAEYVRKQHAGFNVAATENDTIQTLGEKIVNGLKDLRKADPHAGIVSDAILYDVSDEALIYKRFSGNPVATKETVGNFLQQLPKFRSFKSMNEKQIHVQAKEIVDSMLMPRESVLKNLRQYGYNQEQITTLERLYHISRKDQVEGIEKFLHGIAQSEADLVYDFTTGMMGAIHNGKLVTLDSIPKVKFENGQFFIEFGRNQVALHTVLQADMKSIEKNKSIAASKDSVKMVSTLGEAWQKMKYVTSFGRKDQASALDSIGQYIKNLAGFLREGTAIEDIGSLRDIQKQLHVDFKALVGLVPHIGMDDTEFRDNPEAFKKAFLGKRKKPVAWDNLNFHQREIFTKNIAAFRDKLVGQAGDDNVVWFMGRLGLTNKENQVVEYVGMVEMHQSSGLSQFYNNQRPVTAQVIGAVGYHANEIQERLNEIGERSKTALGGRIALEKAAEGMGEKGMMQGIFMGLGERDGRIGKALKQGEVLSYKHSMQLTDTDNIHNTIFSDIGSLDKAKYEEAAKKAGFKSIDEFTDEVWIERYEKSKTLMDKVLGGKASSLVNHSLKSHDNRTLPLEEVISSVVEKYKSTGLSEEEASKKVYDEIAPAFKSETGLRFENGKYIVDHMDSRKGEHIDSNILADFVCCHNLEYEHVDDKGGKHMIAGEKFKRGNVVGNISTVLSVRDYGEIKSLGDALTKDEVRSVRRELRLQKSLEKGIKVTTRVLDLLDLQKYDNAFVELLAKNVSKSKFDEVGHILERNEDSSYIMQGGNHVTQQKYLNRSELKSHTDPVRDNLFFKLGESGLNESTIAKHSERMNSAATKAFPVYASTVEGHAQAGGQKVSTESAEKLYALKKGFSTQAWNAGKLDHDINVLTGEGFNGIKIGEAMRASGNDVDYLLGRDSIFSGNTVLDLSVGVHGGERLAEGSDRYLALPMLPPMTNDGEVIEWKSQEAVQPLINTHQRLLDAYNNVSDHLGNVPDIKNAEARYLEGITAVKDALTTDLSGKNGIFTDLSSYRMDSAVMSKASGMVTYAKNRMGDIGKNLMDNSSDADINSGFLSKTKMGDKLVLQHFQDRRGYDVEDLSTEIFERLGYFKDEAMAKYDIDSSAKDVREPIMMLLEEKGTMIFSQRYPSIKEGYQRPVLSFLDRNTKHNRVSSSAEEWLSAGGDFDGDLAANALAKYRYTDAEGKTQHMDYLEYIMRKESGHAVDANVEEIFKNNKVFITQRASIVNKYYTGEVYANAMDDIFKAITSYDAFTVSGSASLDHKIFGELGPMEKASIAIEHLQTYKELRGKVETVNGGQFEKHRDFRDKANEYIIGLSGRKQANKCYEATVFSEMFTKKEMSAMAKFNKLTIGEVNLPLFSLRRIADVGLDLTEEDTPKRQHVVQYFADAIGQEVISSKKAENIRYSVDKAEQFETALSTALGRDGQELDSSGLRGWINEYLGENAVSASHTKDTYHIKDKQEMVDFTGTIARSVGEGLHDLQQIERLGQQRVGMSYKHLQNALVYAEHDDLGESMVLKMLNETSPEVGIQVLRRDELASDTAYTVRRAVNQASASLKNTPKDLIGDSEQLLNKIKHQVAESGVTSKGLAFKAVGLAGSIMMAGFVGGNPAKPAETHAQEDSEAEYRIPPLTDTNLNNNARGGPKQGYVININAQTSQGQQHVSSAIQQALSSGFNNTNINVAMNIHNSSESNAAQISRMLESAFQ